MSLGATAINVAYGTLILASFTRGLIRLRLLLVLASGGFVVFGVLRGIEAMVFWNAAIGLMHLRQLGWQLYRQRRSGRSGAAERLKADHFADSPPASFDALWRAGTDVEVGHGATIIERGRDSDVVYAIVAGQVDVIRDGRTLCRLGPGAAVGEMSRCSGAPTTADCVAVGATALRRWDGRDLERLAASDPAAALAFERFVQRDLVAKLSR